MPSNNGLTPSIESTCEPFVSTTPANLAPPSHVEAASANALVVAPKAFHDWAGAAMV